MSYGSIRCQVIEIPAGSRRARGGDGPRDLLPWADPYIAGLMAKLERGRDAEDEGGDDPFDRGGFTGHDAARAWRDDAFLPPRSRRALPSAEQPVYGGWPLLDDS
jgi:hypothetical protein